MKKRLWSILLVLCMVFSLLPAAASNAYAYSDEDEIYEEELYEDEWYEEDDWDEDWDDWDDGDWDEDDWIEPSHIDGDFYYIINDSNEAVITRYSGSAENLTIPKTLNKCNVVQIEKNAFADCDFLESVTIPDTVTSIGYNSFRGCTSLQTVTLPKALQTLDGHAFAYCSSLKSIVIPKCLEEVYDWGFGEEGPYEGPFTGCESLSDISFEKGTKQIPNYLFQGITGLKSIVIPESVSSIGSDAFANCENLSEVQLPSHLEAIPENCFLNCTSLKKITIPDSVQEIGYFGFSGSGLTSLTVPDSVKQIKAFAFCDCSSLKSVKLPNSITTIEEAVFYYCSSLKSVVLPNNITSLQSYIPWDFEDNEVCGFFGGCKNLTDVTLPGSLKDIDEGVFSGCSKLKNVYFNNTKSNWKNVTIGADNKPLNKAKIHCTDGTITGGNSSAETKLKFKDVKSSAYYADAVAWAVNHDPVVTTGTDATHFSPNKDCTRAQMVTFLWRAAGEPKPASTKNPFKDVKKGAYYYDAVLWAVGEGITTGTSKNTFSPDATVTRAQTVTFLWRMENEPAVKAKNPFKDVKKGQYYTDAVLWAVKNEITNGKTANTFAPSDPCTRAQIVTFLYRDMK